MARLTRVVPRLLVQSLDPFGERRMKKALHGAPGDPRAGCQGPMIARLAVITCALMPTPPAASSWRGETHSLINRQPMVSARSCQPEGGTGTPRPAPGATWRCATAVRPGAVGSLGEGLDPCRQ